MKTLLTIHAKLFLSIPSRIPGDLLMKKYVDAVTGLSIPSRIPATSNLSSNVYWNVLSIPSRIPAQLFAEMAIKVWNSFNSFSDSSEAEQRPRGATYSFQFLLGFQGT